MSDVSTLTNPVGGVSVQVPSTASDGASNGAVSNGAISNGAGSNGAGNNIANNIAGPAVPGADLFSGVMDAVGTVAEAALSGIPLGMAGDYGPLLALQLKMQQELEATTLLSNIEKTKHEAKMASIRNIRSS